MQEHLAYFKQAATDPASATPWSVWWAANAETVEQQYPIVEFVRLKHRRLKGAIQILKQMGELPRDFQPPDARKTGICPDCGDPVKHETASEGGGSLSCALCGLSIAYDCQGTAPIGMLLTVR